MLARDYGESRTGRFMLKSGSSTEIVPIGFILLLFW